MRPSTSGGAAAIATGCADRLGRRGGPRPGARCTGVPARQRRARAGARLRCGRTRLARALLARCPFRARLRRGPCSRPAACWRRLPRRREPRRRAARRRRRPRRGRRRHAGVRGWALPFRQGAVSPLDLEGTNSLATGQQRWSKRCWPTSPSWRSPLPLWRLRPVCPNAVADRRRRGRNTAAALLLAVPAASASAAGRGRSGSPAPASCSSVSIRLVSVGVRFPGRV